MHLEIIHTTVVEELHHYSLPELARSCGVSEAELGELTDIGVLQPLGPGPDWVFSAASLRAVQSAQRLRRDFELDLSALAVAIQLLARIQALEDQLCLVEARAPGHRG
jgi:chaperone modulatory protein CbpM